MSKRMTFVAGAATGWAAYWLVSRQQAGKR